MASHPNPLLNAKAAPSTEGLVVQVHDSPERIDAAAWDALLERQSAPTPFMRMAYLLALHRSKSAVRLTGWAPCFMTVETADGELLGGCPLYLKSHSYGEYVNLCRVRLSVQITSACCPSYDYASCILYAA